MNVMTPRVTFTLVFIMLFSGACQTSSPTPVSVSTVAPTAASVSASTHTPTPTSTPTPTATFTPTPVPTATPRPGIGVPVSGNRWRITVEGARKAFQITVGALFSEETYTPKSGQVFLVVDFTFDSLGLAGLPGLPSKSIAIIGADGESAFAYGLGSPLGDRYACVDCSATLRPAMEHHMAFIVKEDLVNRPWFLNIQGMPQIPFSVGEEPGHTFTTQIGNERGALPSVCLGEGLRLLSQAGQVIYQDWQDTGMTLMSVTADGTNAAPICAGVAAADLKRASDGGALLLVSPRQGWRNLYAIEPDGKVLALVKNSPEITAQFDPTGRYILFSASKIGEKERQELYIFDRRTASATSIKTGRWIRFRVLANGRLLVALSPFDGGDMQTFLGQADGSSLELVHLPAYTYDYDIAEDGEHLVDAKQEGSSYSLYITQLDGSRPQRLVTAGDWPSGELSPDGQFILVDIPQRDKTRHKAELHNLSTANKWTIVPYGGSLSFGFSTDSRWALVYEYQSDKNGRRGELEAAYVVNTVNGQVVRKIGYPINAIFSTDSKQLAYTVRQADGNPAMYVLSLESKNVQSLDSGVLSGWLPPSPMP